MSLRFTEIRVPNHTVRNSTVRLECFYDMEGDDLYSIKWYKDGHEFFRYSPAELPPIKVFPMAGVSVDVSAFRLRDYKLLANILTMIFGIFEDLSFFC